MDQVLGWRQSNALGRISLSRKTSKNGLSKHTQRSSLLKVKAQNSDDQSRAKSQNGGNYHHAKRRRGRPAHLRSPDDSPLRDGNRDRLIGLLTERAVFTLLSYLFETNMNTYDWLRKYYKDNKIPRDGSWDDVSGETFLRTLLCSPMAESKFDTGRDALFDQVVAVSVDPRSIAQRIMDIRVQLANEFIDELKNVQQENNILYTETLSASLSFDFTPTTDSSSASSTSSSSTDPNAASTPVHPEIAEAMAEQQSGSSTSSTELHKLFQERISSISPTSDSPGGASSSDTVPDSLPLLRWPPPVAEGKGSSSSGQQPSKPKAPKNSDGPAWLIDPDSALSRTGFESHGVQKEEKSEEAVAAELQASEVIPEPVIEVKEEDVAASTGWFAALKELAGEGEAGMETAVTAAEVITDAVEGAGVECDLEGMGFGESDVLVGEGGELLAEGEMQVVAGKEGEVAWEVAEEGVLERATYAELELATEPEYLGAEYESEYLGCEVVSSYPLGEVSEDEMELVAEGSTEALGLMEGVGEADATAEEGSLLVQAEFEAESESALTEYEPEAEVGEAYIAAEYVEYDDSEAAVAVPSDDVSLDEAAKGQPDWLSHLSAAAAAAAQAEKAKAAAAATAAGNFAQDSDTVMSVYKHPAPGSDIWSAVLKEVLQLEPLPEPLPGFPDLPVFPADEIKIPSEEELKQLETLAAAALSSTSEAEEEGVEHPLLDPPSDKAVSDAAAGTAGSGDVVSDAATVSDVEVPEYLTQLPDLLASLAELSEKQPELAAEFGLVAEQALDLFDGELPEQEGQTVPQQGMDLSAFIPSADWAARLVPQVIDEPAAGDVLSDNLVVGASGTGEEADEAEAVEKPGAVDDVDVTSIMSLSIEEADGFDDSTASNMWRIAMRDLIASDLVGSLEGAQGQQGGEPQELVINSVSGKKVWKWGPQGNGKVAAKVTDGVQGKEGNAWVKDDDEGQQEGEGGMAL